MKRLTIFFVLACCLTGTAGAQMDEKFYFPSKDTRKLDSLQAERFVQVCEGDTVTAYLLSPAEVSPKATVMYFHGSGGNVGNYAKLVEPLLKDSFQVFMVDFRGYGHSTGKPTHRNIAADGQQFFEFAVQHQAIKNTKLIVMGVSMGTQIATHLAAANESKISALVLDGTIASFTDIALAYAPKEQQALIRMGLVSPYSAKKDIQLLQKIPVLFIHSKEDKEVPFAQYEMVAANCKVQHRLLLYTGEHIQAPLVAKAEYLSKINALLRVVPGKQ